MLWITIFLQYVAFFFLFILFFVRCQAIGVFNFPIICIIVFSTLRIYEHWVLSQVSKLFIRPLVIIWKINCLIWSVVTGYVMLMDLVHSRIHLGCIWLCRRKNNRSEFKINIWNKVERKMAWLCKRENNKSEL